MTLLLPSALSFQELDIPPYALRGISQTLEPIDQASALKRTINAVLRDVASPDFRKYKSSIRCTDFQSPGLGKLWPGMPLTMSCAHELSFEGSTDDSDGPFERPAVAGSVRDANGFTFYRPVLAVRVTAWSGHFAEWQAEYAWQLDVEET
jgi:hypothetical protein